MPRDDALGQFLPAGTRRGIEPFPTQELRAYDAGYVAGWVVERYQIDLVSAAARESRSASMIQAMFKNSPRRLPNLVRLSMSWSSLTSGETGAASRAPVGYRFPAVIIGAPDVSLIA